MLCKIKKRAGGLSLFILLSIFTGLSLHAADSTIKANPYLGSLISNSLANRFSGYASSIWNTSKPFLPYVAALLATRELAGGDDLKRLFISPIAFVAARHASRFIQRSDKPENRFRDMASNWWNYSGAAAVPLMMALKYSSSSEDIPKIFFATGALSGLLAAVPSYIGSRFEQYADAQSDLHDEIKEAVLANIGDEDEGNTFANDENINNLMEKVDKEEGKREIVEKYIKDVVIKYLVDNKILVPLKDKRGHYELHKDQSGSLDEAARRLEIVMKKLFDDIGGEIIDIVDLPPDDESSSSKGKEEEK